MKRSVNFDLKGKENRIYATTSCRDTSTTAPREPSAVSHG